MFCTLYTEADYTSGTTITVNSPGPRACIDFTDLVVDDGLASEGVEAFAISIRKHGEMAVVTILDDDGKFIIIVVLHVPQASCNWQLKQAYLVSPMGKFSVMIYLSDTVTHTIIFYVKF